MPPLQAGGPLHVASLKLSRAAQRSDCSNTSRGRDRVGVRGAGCSCQQFRGLIIPGFSFATTAATGATFRKSHRYRTRGATCTKRTLGDDCSERWPFGCCLDQDRRPPWIRPSHTARDNRERAAKFPAARAVSAAIDCQHRITGRNEHARESATPCHSSTQPRTGFGSCRNDPRGTAHLGTCGVNSQNTAPANDHAARRAAAISMRHRTSAYTKRTALPVHSMSSGTASAAVMKA
jgi:hypothetical protein